MKRFKEFINEGLLAAMKPKPPEEVLASLNKLTILDRIDTIVENEMGADFLPNVDDIQIEDMNAVIDIFDPYNINDVIDKIEELPELHGIYLSLYNEVAEDILDNALPDGISFSEIEGEKCLTFYGWENFAPLFTKKHDYENYVESVMGDDSFELFEDNSSYDGREDVTDKTLKIITDKIISLSDELGIDYDEDLNSYDLSDLYKYVEDVDGLEEITEAIDHSYGDAQSDANYSEAYNTIISDIKDKFSLDDEVNHKEAGTGGKDTQKSFHYMKLTTSIEDIIDFDEYLDEGDCDGIISIELSMPHYGFSGVIDKEYFSNQIEYKITDM